jgi:DNA-binding NtrC family response regulator
MADQMVLVVSADPAFRRSAVRALSYVEGLQAVSMSPGPGVVPLVRSARPTAVVADRDAVDGDESTLAAGLGEHADSRAVPIIVVAAGPATAAAEDSPGRTRIVLQHPVSPTALAEAVRGLLAARSPAASPTDGASGADGPAARPRPRPSSIGGKAPRISSRE